MKERTFIDVILVEPMKKPKLIRLEDSLEAMQETVKGQIESYMPFPEEVAVVCNEDSKWKGMELNRAIYDEQGRMLDQSLSAEGLREEYQKTRNHKWILKVEGESLKDGLKHLTERQLLILEGLFFERKCLEDICQMYGMSHEDADKEIRKMHIKLTMC